jgi:ferric-dicitrate binding protein FerR (iron transport regulator)
MNAEMRPDVNGAPRSAPFQTAAAWVSWLERHPKDAEAKAACTAWRNESIEHDEAFKRAERTWRAMGEVADHPVLSAWRESARTTRLSRRPWLAAAGVATVALLAGGTVWFNGRPGPERSQMPTPAVAPMADVVPHPGEYRIATTRLG